MDKTVHFFKYGVNGTFFTIMELSSPAFINMEHSSHNFISTEQTSQFVRPGVNGTYVSHMEQTVQKYNLLYKFREIPTELSIKLFG